jgi:hypothetical protein
LRFRPDSACASLRIQMNGPDQDTTLAGNRREQELIDKIRRLPADKLAEVEDRDCLRQCQEERRLAKAVRTASEDAFAKVWDNPDDAEYDYL